MSQDVDQPGDREIVQRVTGRVVPVDGSGRVLLLHGFEPARPEWTFWFMIGGGVEADESPRQAAARELAEEAGIVVDEAALGEPFRSERVAFNWGAKHLIQDETYFALAVDGEIATSLAGLEEVESQTIDAIGWIRPSELADGTAVPARPGLIACAVDACRLVGVEPS